MLELLNQLDGFDSRSDVKVIMATNRIESLDPALIRPGRIDSKIKFPFPDEKTKRPSWELQWLEGVVDRANAKLSYQERKFRIIKPEPDPKDEAVAQR